ncbi:MAG: DUF4294 domain-containing protein [Saprospiraceae bacterium]
MKNWIFFLLPAFLATSLVAQTADTFPKGAWARMEVVNGDTTFDMTLNLHRVSSKRAFKDFTEQRQYYLYTRAARKVYPFALEALDLYAEIADQTEDMNKRQRRRFIRHEHKELKEDLKDQMKNLSRTEGKVLIKMIESQVGESFYDLLRETRGGATATYWNTLGKMWDYDLKEGYRPGADPLLDEVFIDYDFGMPPWMH